MIKRSLLTITLVALLALTSVLHADPPVDPTPPAGYVYGSQTVNTSLSQSVGSSIVSNGDFSVGGGWTLESGWSISGGVASHTSGSSSAFYQSNDLVTNDFYEAQFDIVSYTGSGCVQLFLGVAGSSTSCYGEVGTYRGLVRFTSAVSIAGMGASYDFHGSVDNIVVRPITRASTYTGTDDATNTLNFSLPVSPLPGERIELRYRVQDNQNYMAVRLQRNAANTNWDLSLIRVTSTVVATQISQSNVGNVTALRVMSVEDYHYVYAGIGGSFTYFWTIIDASHNTATGVTGIWNDAFSGVSISSWSIVDESSITPTPTPDASQTPTPTATPDLVVYGNVNGQPTRYVYSVTAADHAEITILITILISIWALVLAALFILRNKS